MKITNRFFYALVMCWCLIIAPCHSATDSGDGLVVYSPYIDEGIGLGADDVLAARTGHILDQIFSSRGLALTVRPRPFIRLGPDTREDSNACAAFVSPFFAGQEGLHWIGPVMDVTPSLYARPGLNDRPLASLELLHGRRVGVLRGTVIPRLLLSVADTQYEWVTFETQNLKKLKAGRIDYWLAPKQTAEILALEYGLVHFEPIYEFSPKPTGLGCNREMSATLLEALTQAVARFYNMHQAGR